MMGTLRTMTRVGLGLGAAAVVVTLAAGVYAQNTSDPRAPFMGQRGGPGGPGQFGGPDGGRGGMDGVLGGLPLARLGLTDAQRTEVRSIAQSHAEELRAIADRALTARRTLDAAVTGETVDEGLIRARAAELAMVEADMAVARARVHAEVFRVLTPEQQTQARQLRSQMQERFESRRERMRERRPAETR